ncbi:MULTISPECIES: cation-transporting P-type ATPase [Enterobacter]|jgi:magnesium-transporting ATPase (P-type)|uniref:Carbonate dehydratase n=1 Tax=Enterobacter bugandensis TaxID=881260 RepID=A0ABX4VRS8_9ENTR|nr:MULTISPECIES: cation-transporting P-type ATPase [Enterobacter]MBZ6367226.1 cation-transporting P-type ATPase [Enterobacter bugandensis]NUX26096.1 cation-transporting P-type ATPase [Enterobacter bugandensis]NUX49473.1 cation-transporting P-type ATPase [Enterobacter bugandensis]NUX69911.1 cation-transporting P-type ATPase [Enterobacter bugandensis]NUX95235.1 cation-transporting P-type ATPase [Enterobacter bugandensis]
MKTGKPERPYYQQTVDETLSNIHSTLEGLSGTEASARLQQHGENALPKKKGKPAWLRFLAHFNDVLIYVLLVAALLKLFMGHWVDMFVILGVAIINALIGHIQESNAEKSLQSIRNMLSSEAVVVRQGNHETIPTTELVPGDIVVIRAGDRIPADLRVIEAHNLRVEEAILTGESTVVEKNSDALSGELPLGDRYNLLYSGTTVSSGGGKGVVVATGGETELGHINQMMSDIEKHRTPLMVQMDKLGKTIFITILVMMVALFVFSLLFRDMPVSELVLSLISLAVAAVPEGLPAIISIILSLGVQAMARRKAIIRKLPTVETLGAMTVICSDKTGTLTMNEMTVKAVITADTTYRVEGDSYEPVGNIHPVDDPTPVSVTQGSLLERYLRTIDLCNDSQLIKDEQGLWKITGGPTEGALKVLAAKIPLPPLDTEMRSKIPFDSQYKYMSTLYRLGEEEAILITGAPDVLFRLCQYQQTNDGLQPFDQPYWEGKIEEYAREGLRMVAAAWKPAREGQRELDHPDLHDGVILLGIAGMMDPPRPEAITAIADCLQAGIRVKMITGDHPQTAMSIGQMLGIGNAASAITGRELEAMDDRQLSDAAQQYDIFARTSPEDKFRLVQALQSKQEVVGMTGDGVNDAPALKRADVGIAMGIKGTEVTKEAADMVLTDDNFATIASAVHEGRRVYDNLKKTILFVIPSNIAQALLIIIALLAGNLIPLTPVLILWMNMATSATLSFGLAFEAGEKNIMNRPPRKANLHVMDGYAIWRVVFVGLMIAISAFVLEAWLQPRGYSAEFIRTVLLQTLVTAQWFYMLNCRVNDGFSLSKGLLANKGIWIVSGVLLALQLLIIYAPFMQMLFGTEALPFRYWVITFLIGFVMFLIVEAEKVLTRRWRKIEA